MKYTLTLINGKAYEITEEEYHKLNGKTGLIHIPSIDCVVNLSSVCTIERSDKIVRSQIDRMKQLEGVTPDGEVVIKRFGRWYYRDANEYQRDDNGQSILAYEGEQLLPTPEEYERDFKSLAPEGWKMKLIGLSSEIDDRLLVDRDGRITQGLERIGA